jgi:hypothetical protein
MRNRHERRRAVIMERRQISLKDLRNAPRTCTWLVEGGALCCAPRLTRATSRRAGST